MKHYLLVADVLGFSNITTNLSHAELSGRVRAWMAIVENTRRETGVEGVQLLSDTLFAWEADTGGAPDSILKFSKELLERAIGEYFPLRGAITYGEVGFLDSVIYGATVVEAHDLERSLDWLGIACGELPTVPWSWDLVCCYPVPKKPVGKTIKLSPAIIWDIPEDLLGRCISHGLLKDGDGILWDTYSKVKNTVAFSDYVQRAKGLELAPDKMRVTMLLP